MIWVPEPKLEPGQTAPSSAEILAGVGLADWATGFDTIHTAGPGETGPGFVFAWRDAVNVEMCVNEARQDWVPALETHDEMPGSRYWVGFRKEKVPGPEDLQRPYKQRGSWVLLGRHKWLFPQPAKLTAHARWRDRGRIEYVTDRRFDWFVHEVQRRREELLATKEQGPDGKWLLTLEHDRDDVMHFLLTSLRLNYRLTQEVATYVDETLPGGFLNTDNYLGALLATTGLADDGITLVEDE